MNSDVTQAQQIRNALKLKDLELPEKPRIASLRWDYYEDSSGDDSLRIWVILADDTADDDITGEAVHAIKWAVRDRLESNGVHLFPYFTFARESDVDNGPGQD